MLASLPGGEERAETLVSRGPSGGNLQGRTDTAITETGT